MEIAPFVVSIVSTVAAAGAVVAAVVYGRKQHMAAERAVAAAQQSAAEATRAADASERSAKAAETTAATDAERRLEESRPDIRVIMARPSGLSDDEPGDRIFAAITLHNRSGIRLASVTLEVVGSHRGFGQFNFQADHQNQPVHRWGWLPGAERAYTFEHVEPGLHPRKPLPPRRQLLFADEHPEKPPITFLVTAVAADGRTWPPVQVQAE